MLDVLQPLSADDSGDCDCHKCSSASCCRVALLQKLPQTKSSLSAGSCGALSISEVAPELLICGAASLRPGVLAALGVTHVINCTAELPDTPVPSGASLLRVPLLDVDSAAENGDLEAALVASCDAIEDAAHSGGRALVHCIAGVSRSAALVLGYLVAVRRIPLATAFALLRGIRPVARPRAAFFRVLIEWERRHLGCTSVTMMDIPGWACQIPDVYAKDYHNTLRFQARYGR